MTYTCGTFGEEDGCIVFDEKGGRGLNPTIRGKIGFRDKLSVAQFFDPDPLLLLVFHIIGCEWDVGPHGGKNNLK